MSNHYIADNHFEKEAFVEELRKLGHPGCEVKYIKGGRYDIISPGFKGFRELSDEFKRRKIRKLGPLYLKEQELL